MKMIDRNVQAPATRNEDRPVPGAYTCVITDVQDCPGKSHLKVWFDILVGPYKGHFSRIREAHPDMREWYGMYRKYYTPAALWSFDKFTDAVSRSNGKFVFDGGMVNADERTLVGKKIGLVFRAKEYYSNDGKLRTRLEVLKEVLVVQVPYQPTPETLTIAKQEEIERRKAERKAAQAPESAQQPARAPEFAQQTYGVQQQFMTPALSQFVDVSNDMHEMTFM